MRLKTPEKIPYLGFRLLFSDETRARRLAGATGAGWADGGSAQRMGTCDRIRAHVIFSAAWRATTWAISCPRTVASSLSSCGKQSSRRHVLLRRTEPERTAQHGAGRDALRALNRLRMPVNTTTLPPGTQKALHCDRGRERDASA